MGDDLRWLRVEVVFATATAQEVRRVEVPEGCTVEQAIRQSGLEPALPDEGLSRVGVFGRLCALSDRVAEGDRIEIYRELTADPKATRRRRAAQKLRDGARRG
ncbi:hypothetical protein DFR24_0561 [Panacagrimonas perspica]|uniref:UPF0125 protein DFR24_0561 n=1 Tax=Panacagrimonas perspica TaxID=381431 RepID=A0A4R7PD62_9GAMM|nr:RnfH family protein [Panacagrimonas perspica]TDU31200.1 hypothetical protein DFR24_0561 [Panacagrimonas perspica]